MNVVIQREWSFLLSLWGLSDPRIAELREMPRCFSIKLHSETQISGRLGMSGGRSPRHAQNPLSGEWRKTLSITHHVLSPPPSHHYLYIIHLINWLQRFHRIRMSLKKPFVPKSDLKQWFTTTTTPYIRLTLIQYFVRTFDVDPTFPTYVWRWSNVSYIRLTLIQRFLHTSDVDPTFLTYVWRWSNVSYIRLTLIQRLLHTSDVDPTSPTYVWRWSNVSYIRLTLIQRLLHTSDIDPTSPTYVWRWSNVSYIRLTLIQRLLHTSDIDPTSPTYVHTIRNKWNESGFRPLLCTYRLNWARRTSWGWWDEWDDTVLQTQDSKFEPWRSEAENASSRSRRLPTILSFTCGWGGGNIFVSFKPRDREPKPNSSVKGSGANYYHRTPAHH